jgi:hypothetical protein
LFAKIKEEEVMPIHNVQITNPKLGRIALNFDYPVRPKGFDHAVVAIIEQDGSRDVWSLRRQPRWIAGSGSNSLTTSQLRFYNETSGRFISSHADTAGHIDDQGGRFYVVNLDLRRSGDHISLNFPFGAQPDWGGTLEFYGLIGIVSVVKDDIPVALLGDLFITDKISGVQSP